MSRAIGETLTFVWPLTDSAGASLTGKAASIVTIVARLISPTGAVSTFVPSAWSEIGSTGTYVATFVAAAVGDHYLHARYSESGQTVQNRAATISVVTAAQADPAGDFPTAAEIVAAILTVGSTLTPPLNPTTGTMTVAKGNDYTVASGLPFVFDATGFPSLIGATVEWRAIRDGRPRLTVAMTVVDADTARCELDSDDTNRLRVGATYTYEVQETSPDEITIATGSLVVQGP